MWHLKRSSHPYSMYDGILAEPLAFGEVVRRAATEVSKCKFNFGETRELLVVAAGSSLYAAQFAHYLSWEVLKTQKMTVISSSDFVEFSPTLQPGTVAICISHRGNERCTSRSVERIVRSGHRCVYVVGQDAKLSHLQGLEFEVLETTPQEQSPAHTWSYVGSMAVLCALLQELNSSHALLSPKLLQESVPDALENMLASENLMQQLASECTGARKIWIVGAGADAAIAREVALKIVETSYLVAQGYELEEVIQGPLQGAHVTDVFIVLNSTGRFEERLESLRQAISILGIRGIFLSSSEDTGGDPGLEMLSEKLSTVISIPRHLPYPYASLQGLIALQFFAYYLALACGKHPDSFRLDEERFVLAREKVPG